MKWYGWCLVLVVVDLIMLALVGAQSLPVETLGFLLALQAVVVSWTVVVWLVRRVLAQ